MVQTNVQADANRIGVPDEVFEAGIVEPDGRLYWAYASDENAAYVSGVEGPLADADRLETVGAVDLDGRETRIPQQFFGKDRTDTPNPLGLFDYGKPLEWTVLGDPDMCRVEPA